MFLIFNNFFIFSSLTDKLNSIRIFVSIINFIPKGLQKGVTAGPKI
jgi:hypothetical protein